MALARDARACRCCADLPLGPRPIFQVSATARVLINSQAPGTRAHGSGIPFNDPSGNRLRGWLGIDRDVFYDASRIAIVPTGLCYPGRLPNGGDAPPRPACAPLWLDRFIAALPALRLTLLVGSHAQDRRWGRGVMTDRVRDWRAHAPAIFPLPHPSWRTIGWAAKNPWFEAELLPALRAALRDALADQPGQPRP